VASEVEGIPGRKLCVIRNGIDVQRFTPVTDSEQAAIRRSLGLPSDAFIVGTVGRFSWEKNYASLIKSFRRFEAKTTGHPPQTDPAMLLMVGDGPKRTELKEAARSEAGGEVVMPGLQRDVLPWLRAMDVFCLSSVSEGTSITLLEAGACARSSVVTDVGGNGEIVSDGQSGCVVPLNDEAAFARSLMNLWQDRQRSRAFGQVARERVCEHYSLDGMVDAYLALYRRLTGK
jgi:glycosyltransferase involved in cell wall biosynthesis